MFKIWVRTVLTLIFAMAVLGCAKGYPEWERESALDRNWGRSFESAKHGQILNPEAGKNLGPVEGLQGPAEEKIMERHIEGEKAKKKAPTEFGVLTIKQ